MEKFFVIQKYKPLYRPFKRRTRYNQTSIYGLMADRDYRIFQEIEIGDEKIKNYNKYVEKYLTQYVTEKGETVVKQKIDPITVMKKTLSVFLILLMLFLKSMATKEMIRIITMLLSTTMTTLYFSVISE
mgnify:CR=1 FL=1